MDNLTIEEIKKLIPHRYPFLLVDRVLEVEEGRIISIKNVTANEEFFNGHFPKRPMMPGVLQVEAIAQTGCLMLMHSHIDNPEDFIPVFTGINKAKFRKSVVPGDQLKMEVKLVNERRNFYNMTAEATVDGKVVCELDATAAIVPSEE